METDTVVKEKIDEVDEELQALIFPQFLNYLKKLENAQWAILIRKKTTGNLASEFQEKMATPPRWEIRYLNPFGEEYRERNKRIYETLTKVTFLKFEKSTTLATFQSFVPNDVFFFDEAFGEPRPDTPTVRFIKYRGQLFPWIRDDQLLGAYFGAVNPSVLEHGNRIEYLDKDLDRDPEDAQFKRKMTHKMSQIFARMRMENLRRQQNENRQLENDENRDPSGRRRRIRAPNPHRVRHWHPNRYWNVQNQQVVPVPPTDEDTEEPYVFFQFMPSDTYYELAYELTVQLNTQPMTVERRAKKLKYFDWCHSLWLQQCMCEEEEHGERECHAEYQEIFTQMRNLFKRHMMYINQRTPWRDDRQRSEWLENYLADTPPVEFETSDEANEFWQRVHKKAMEKYYSYPKEAYLYEMRQALSNLLYYCKLYAREETAKGIKSTYEQHRDAALRTFEDWDDIRNVLKATVEEGHPDVHSTYSD